MLFTTPVGYFATFFKYKNGQYNKIKPFIRDMDSSCDEIVKKVSSHKNRIQKQSSVMSRYLLSHPNKLKWSIHVSGPNEWLVDWKNCKGSLSQTDPKVTPSSWCSHSCIILSLSVSRICDLLLTNRTWQR